MFASCCHSFELPRGSQSYVSLYVPRPAQAHSFSRDSISTQCSAMTPRTPHKTSVQIDATINDLNAKWSLELPRLHGVEADKAEKGTQNPASRCSLAIRFLCWKSANLEGALEEFAEQAKVVLSSWVYKPRQEPGTILSLPQTKSFIRRDVLAKQDGRLIPEQREILLKILTDILSEEQRLISESDCYERTPSCSKSRTSSLAPSRSASFIMPAPVSRSASSVTSATITVTETNENRARASPRKRENSTTRQIVSMAHTLQKQILTLP